MLWGLAGRTFFQVARTREGYSSVESDMAQKPDKSTIERLLAQTDGASEVSEELSLAIFSGLIAFGDNTALKSGILTLENQSIDPSKLHEIILQSYLFCGFPRMLEALFCLAEIIPPDRYLDSDERGPSDPLAYTSDEMSRFESDGRRLIKTIYAERYERLEEAVWKMSPEVFRLMVMEGYGKTLSRTKLNIITRELAIVAALTVDGRVRQLQAHLRGALNVGATAGRLAELFDALSPISGSENTQTARTLLKEITSPV